MHFLSLIISIIFCIHFFLSPLQGMNTSTVTIYPPDISFCIVDLKYNKPNLKICEFGQGVYSGFKGHHRLFSADEIWKNLWNFLSKFNKPTFLITPGSCKNVRSDVKAIRTLNALGGTRCSNLKMFESLFQQTKAPLTILSSITQADGILVPDCPCITIGSYDQIYKKYPTLLVLDSATKDFVLNKLKTHTLFMNDSELEQYRPQCLTVPTQYKPKMAEEILDTLKSSYLVIKPMDSWKGKGILFIKRQDLEQTLQIILTSKASLKSNPDESYAFWANYEKPSFLIESLETSQPIAIDGKHYDATMRVAFGLAYNEGTISIEFFGAYWKLPEKSYEEKGSLSELYKSHIKEGMPCSAQVDDQIYEEVKNILRLLLPKVYIKMIQEKYNTIKTLGASREAE